MLPVWYSFSFYMPPLVGLMDDSAFCILYLCYVFVFVFAVAVAVVATATAATAATAAAAAAAFAVFIACIICPARSYILFLGWLTVV
jgi:uncharacterized membrane protein